MIASIPLQDVVFGRFGPTIAIAADAATLRAGDLWFDLDFKEQSGSAARAPGGGRVPVLSAASFAATVAGLAMAPAGSGSIAVAGPRIEERNGFELLSINYCTMASGCVKESRWCRRNSRDIGVFAPH
jgi:hypothetical protein